MVKHFKVHLGYDKSLSIDEIELEKVLKAQIIGGVVMLKDAVIKASMITLIEPDYHRAMGFNEGYKLTPEDWHYINRDCADYKGYIGLVKEKLQIEASRGNLSLE